MFDPILAPDSHRGPATGDTTEHGTTWKEAVARINDAFAELFERGKEAIEPATGVTAEFTAHLNARFEEAEAEVASLKGALSEVDAALARYESALSDALFKLDAHEATIVALTTPASDPPPPEATGPGPDTATGVIFPPSEPADPENPVGVQALDPEGHPATGGTPGDPNVVVPPANEQPAA